MDTTDSNWVLEKIGNIKDVYRLRFGSNIIGRHSSADFQVDSSWVSRKHAEIIVPKGNNRIVQLKDLQTLNGTFVNDKVHRTDPVALKRDDVIGFGVNAESNDMALPLYCLRYRPIVYREPTVISYLEIDSEEETTNAVPNIKMEVDIKPNISEIQITPEVKPTVCEITKKIIVSVDLLSDDEELLRPNLQTLHSTGNETDSCTTKHQDVKTDVHLPTGSPNCFDVSNESDANATVNDDSVEDAEIYTQVLLDEMKSDMVDEEKIFFLDHYHKIDLLPDEENQACPVISLIDDDDENENDDVGKNDVEERDAHGDMLLEIWSQKLFSSQIFPRINLSQEFSPTRSVESNSSLADTNSLAALSSDEEDNLLQNIFKPIQNSPENTKPLLLSPQNSPKEESSNDSVPDSKSQIKKLQTSVQDLNQNDFKPTTSNESKLLESPVIRCRRRKRALRLKDSEDEQEMDVKAQSASTIAENKLSKEQSVTATVTKLKQKEKRRAPRVISPLPLKRRRTSKSADTAKKETSTHSPLTNSKPNQSSAQTKVERKERLRRISISAKSSTSNTHSSIKCDDEELKKQNSKSFVKNTTHNRGAFLLDINDAIKPAEAVSNRQKSKSIPPPSRSVDVPLLESVKEEWLYKLKRPTVTTTTTNLNAAKIIDKNSPTASSLPFEQAIAECHRRTNQVLRQNAERARERNKPKKLRFVDVDKSFEEKERLDQKLQQILRTYTNTTTTTEKKLPKIKETKKPKRLETMATEMATLSVNESVVTPAASTSSKKPKKTVRFAENPTIYYFESEDVGHLRKVDTKDLLPHLPLKTRRELVRKYFSFTNHSDELTRLILKQSNEYLFQKTAKNINPQLSDREIIPLPTKFESFEQYSSVFLRIMKFEFWALLDRDMKFHSKSKKKPLHVVINKISNCDNYFLLETYCPLSSPKKCDLVLLKIGDANIQTFGYMVNCTKSAQGSNGSKLYIEIPVNCVEETYLRRSKSVTLEMVIDNLQVIIGAYNGIYQLESSPLTEIILNPSKLLEAEYKTPDRVVSLQFPTDTLNQQNELNEMQAHTVKQIFKRTCLNKTDTTPNITLVQGSPGTGKSIVIFKTVLQILYGMDEKFRDKKILICAQSNAAVDAVAAKLLNARTMIKNKQQRFKLVRFGFVDKMDQQVQPLSLKYHVEFDRVMKLNAILKTNFSTFTHFQQYIHSLEQDTNKTEAKTRELQMLMTTFNTALSTDEEDAVCAKYLDVANVVLTTLSSCVKLAKFVNYFDICIIHEATQCTEPWTMLPLQFGISSLILVGDSQQLPATVLSNHANKNGLSQSLFIRIERCIADELKNTTSNAAICPALNPESDIIYRLHTQYRMHPDICKFPNVFFYGSNVINAPITLHHITPLVPYAVLNLQSTQNLDLSQGKIVNQSEADFVMELLRELNTFIPTSRNSYGIVTPYAQHRNILDKAVSKSGLKRITVHTIDSYQGVEKDVVIISNARTNGVGFLSNPQRLNVALTRPRKCLILCGNFKNLQSVPVWRRLLQDAKQRKVYHEITSEDLSDIKKRVIACYLMRK